MMGFNHIIKKKYLLKNDCYRLRFLRASMTKCGYFHSTFPVKCCANYKKKVFVHYFKVDYLTKHLLECYIF